MIYGNFRIFILYYINFVTVILYDFIFFWFDDIWNMIWIMIYDRMIDMIMICWLMNEDYFISIIYFSHSLNDIQIYIFELMKWSNYTIIYSVVMRDNTM